MIFTPDGTCIDLLYSYVGFNMCSYCVTIEVDDGVARGLRLLSVSSVSILSLCAILTSVCSGSYSYTTLVAYIPHILRVPYPCVQGEYEYEYKY